MAQWLEKKSNWLKNNSHAEEENEPVLEKEPFDYGVEFIPLRCPRCRSKNIKCYGSHPPVRYHYCRACGCNFKSIEKDL